MRPYFMHLCLWGCHIKFPYGSTKCALISCVCVSTCVILNSLMKAQNAPLFHACACVILNSLMEEQMCPYFMRVCLCARCSKFPSCRAASCYTSAFRLAFRSPPSVPYFVRACRCLRACLCLRARLCMRVYTKEGAHLCFHKGI
jgi:hypothetical protein